MQDAFDITTPGYRQQFTFLSLRIFQSESGISIDQTQHIYTNILSEWYDNPKITKKHDTPIKAHPTYEHDLAQCPPLTPTELQAYEQKYH